MEELAINGGKPVREKQIEIKEIEKVLKSRNITQLSSEKIGEFESAFASHLGVKYAGCFSFQESKNITCGEGGMVVTNNPKIERELRLLRHHGEPAWYVYERYGKNCPWKCNKNTTKYEK